MLVSFPTNFMKLISYGCRKIPENYSYECIYDASMSGFVLLSNHKTWHRTPIKCHKAVITVSRNHKKICHECYCERNIFLRLETIYYIMQALQVELNCSRSSRRDAMVSRGTTIQNVAAMLTI